MGRIQILDTVVANQIAAGEVVERPASVVKELIENALDAQASHIDVRLDGDGTDLIRITDDGVGMAADDAVLCFSRYATSKLRGIDDLQELNSFGFRGEAMPSIASVAKIHMSTRTKEAQLAADVQLEGGYVTHVGESGASFGTRIDVKDLFYNVPARRKFLKSGRSESAAVEHVVRTAALSQPHVGFKLTVDGKVVLDVRQADLDADLSDPRRLERAIACLGEDVRAQLFPFEAHTELVRLSGYVVAPLVTRRDSKGIRLFVNRRAVEDKQLTTAAKVAFRTLLEVGRFPICALNIEVDPSVVDVNVHPQKLEVRFSDPSRIQSHIIRLLSDFLATTPWISRGPEKTFAVRDMSSVGFSLRASEPAPYVPDGASHPGVGRDPGSQNWIPHQARNDNDAGLQIMPLTHVPTEGHRGGATRFDELRIVGQVDQTFLVLEAPHAMIVVDQHAAHERVMFEQIRARIQSEPLPSQPMLVPFTMKVTATQAAAFTDEGGKLAHFGFDISQFGDRELLVRAMPQQVDAARAESLLKDALDELASSGRTDGLNEFSDHICAQLACHGSVRAGQKLSSDEITALLAQLDTIDYNAHCPHGRPVVRAVPFHEMAKWFSRL